jgi:Nucleotidyltransferase domain
MSWARRACCSSARARGDARPDSDYDLIIVSPRFADVEPPRRAIGLRQRWYAVGGEGAMDLVCITPDEFELARHRISLIAAVLPEARDLLLAEASITSADAL